MNGKFPFLKIFFSLIPFYLAGTINNSCKPSFQTTTKYFEKTCINLDYDFDSINVSSDSILSAMVEVLNDGLKKNYQEEPYYDFQKAKKMPLGFFIFDLICPENNSVNNIKVEFINNHIYHFADPSIERSFSHILILNENSVKIFAYLNCKNQGDNIKDVLDYINHYGIDKLFDKKLNPRIRNYRKFGLYGSHHGFHKKTYCPN